ncbi:4062_t:CDS:10 [Acaulospora morrowiae]|uniref:4062_t:CDS:1 n=1 Tax=Acaulospora morrowiae TaxID=94023 RepID=A0A9N8Z8D0_9GLOM|nr:4062_t:CDS:10 [Acaulospora morrowiae]
MVSPKRHMEETTHVNCARIDIRQNAYRKGYVYNVKKVWVTFLQEAWELQRVTFPVDFEGASASDVLVIIHGVWGDLKNEKASRVLWMQIENMQSSELIEEKRNRVKRKVDLCSVDIFDKSTTNQGNEIMNLYDVDNPKKKLKIQSNSNDDDFFDGLYIDNESEDASTEIQHLPIESEEMFFRWSHQPKRNRIQHVDQNGKTIKPLINKYAFAIEVKPESIFDDDAWPLSTRVIFDNPFEGEFDFKKHYELLWVRDIYQRFMFLFASSFNILRDANTLEIAYRDSFVNPIIPKAFDDMNNNIMFQIGEIESALRKQHRNQTNGQKPRVSLGSKHDGILKIYMNAIEIEIGFLEVVGNAMNVDLTGYYEDMEKLFKGLQLSDILASKNLCSKAQSLFIFVVMQLSIFYQRQHHLERNATEEQLLYLQSFGVLVYQRETIIYTIHRVKGGLHVVDIITKFTIPDNKDQVYVIDEIIEKVYFFKSRIMDYYLKLQKISRKAKKYSPSDENPLEASPSKRATTRQ